jgi:hypothetical protein
MRQKPKNGYRRISRTTLACVAALIGMALSVSAFSDTYNFYFSKPKKNAQNAPAAEQDDPDDATDSGTSPAVPPVTTQPAGSGAVGVTPNGQSPIIINNNNNIHLPQGEPAGPAAPATAPLVAPPAPPGDPAKLTAPALSASLTAPGEARAPWRFGLGAVYFIGGTTVQGPIYDSEYYGEATGEGSVHTLGASVSLGYFFVPAFGINGYVAGLLNSGGTGNGVMAGGDLEFAPFRLTVGNLDVLELGLLAGANKYLYTTFDDDVFFYAGARVSLNLDRHFGLTASVRTNFSAAMLEGGIITHF